MSRNIVLCCDGTSNQFSQDRTNVIKLFHSLEKDPAHQAVYYHPGIGTRAPTGIGTRSGTLLAKAAGLAVGYGLRADIVDGYCFILQSWQPGDRLYIFGFSRGAYTARALAGMLRLYGMIPPGNEVLVPYAVEMMWKIAGLKTQQQRDAYFRLADDFKSMVGGRGCRTHFLGLWDTVNSVGWISSPLALPYSRHNSDVAIVRHAKALDERRGFFRVNWVDPAPGQDVSEVWFPGSHCDVGGGFPEADSGMSKYPLRWMAQEARQAGLLLDDARLAAVLGADGTDNAAPSPLAPLHNSMTPVWSLAELVPKKHWSFPQKDWEWRMNLFRRRTTPVAPVVHDVAWEIPGYALPGGAVRLSDQL